MKSNKFINSRDWNRDIFVVPLFCLVKLNTNVPCNSAIVLLDAHMRQETFTRIFTAALYIKTETHQGSMNGGMDKSYYGHILKYYIALKN